MEIPLVAQDLFDEVETPKNDALRALVALTGGAHVGSGLEGVASRLMGIIHKTEAERTRLSGVSASLVKVALPTAEVVAHHRCGGKAAKVVEYVTKAVLHGRDRDSAGVAVALGVDCVLGLALPLRVATKTCLEAAEVIAHHKQALQKAAKMPEQVSLDQRRFLGCDGVSPEGAAVMGSAFVEGASGVGEVVGAAIEALEHLARDSLEQLGREAHKLPE